ncbi:MAG: transcription-repair coupling factor [Lactobacillales bacterium]|nr:transcription-repair coupling factor [Lactobacillales bacterium]
MNLLEKISKNVLVSSWQKNHFLGYRQLLTGLSGSIKTLLIASSLRICKNKILIVVPTLSSAYFLAEDLRLILPKATVHVFPVDELFSAEMAISSPEARSERIQTLNFLMSDLSGIVVVPTAGIRRMLPAPEAWQENHLSFESGKDVDVEKIPVLLLSMGYHRVSMVTSPGEFSVRGSIVDVYPLNERNPIRVEFFDTEIDSIRTFEADTQKSIEKIDSFVLSPASDLIYSKENFQQGITCLESQFEKRMASLSDSEEKAFLAQYQKEVVENFAKGIPGEYASYYSDFLYKEKKTIIDYLSMDSFVYFDDYARILEVEREVLLEESSFQTMKLSEMKVFQNQVFGVDVRDSLKKIKQSQTFFTLFHKGLGNLKFDKVHSFNQHGMQKFFSQMPLLKVEVDRWLKQGNTVVILVSTEERIQKVERTFSEFELVPLVTDSRNIIEGELQIVLGTFSSGFDWVDEKLVVITEREIFHHVTKKRIHRRNISNAERLKSYNELNIGDYVVHVSHGIGRFLGIETLEINGLHQDYLKVLYQNEDKLFVPVTQLNLISKYVGSADKVPGIHRLSDHRWARSRTKVAKQVEDIADDLIELYSKREAQRGFAFSKDSDLQKKFEDEFPYAETEDQLRSSSEIKKDMERTQPMDRLLVGDVGFGKTEVALRASFKAIQDNKQVAFLVPTTVLSHQHFRTMSYRFEDFPVNIAQLSRFQSKKEQEEIIRKLKKGQIDFLVGTHRILSEDIGFADLGLLIIDEEQRFGVKHKERLKQLRTNVDVLTLTATPIPRTLHMSMMGVRDLSVIETPPANRFPVQTYVVEMNRNVIREGILREIARGGQAFYLYNRVDTMEQKVNELSELIPEARIGFAHGRLTETQLEDVLYDFMEVEYDVLVTTTIIETGIDFPNVNTIFVENADYMGLSTLYQLRGRVGRSNRVAYAYFMYQSEKILTEVSEKRLEAIKDFTELGSGFKVAMRDLSIRGAGNILGAQQHGFIDTVGFDLYSQMLEEAVRKKQGNKNDILRTSVEIDLGIDAYLPTSYISDERQKIEIYKRIREFDTHETADELEEEMIDRFGEYPEEVAFLLVVGRLKMDGDFALLEMIQKKVGALEDNLSLIFSKEGSEFFNGEEIFRVLSETRLKANLSVENGKMIVNFAIEHSLKPQIWLQEVSQFVFVLRQRSKLLHDKEGEI